MAKPFRAKRIGTCPRCGKAIEVGDRIVYIEDHADPVHDTNTCELDAMMREADAAAEAEAKERT